MLRSRLPDKATIWAIARKDLQQIARDRTLLLFMLLVPVAQLILLAQATGRGVRELPIGVLDLDASASSRALCALIAASDGFELVMYPASLEEGTGALERGEINALLIIPAGLEAAMRSLSQTVTLQLIVDGSNSVVGSVARSQAQVVVQRYLERQGLDATRYGGVQVVTLLRYNPGGRSRPPMIVAQLGFITYQITLATAALGLTREREAGTLEQLLVTPVQRFELLGGKVVAPLVIGLLDFGLMLVVVRYGFGIPVVGSPWLVIGVTVLFMLIEIVWGVMLSALSRTQQQAILMVFMQAMLDVALSGYLAPTHQMPWLLRTVAQVIPFQHYLVMLRGIILKGAGVAALMPHLQALGALLLVLTPLTVGVMARRLE